MPQPLSFAEELISQIPAVRLLKAMGYTYLTPDEMLEAGNVPRNTAKRLKDEINAQMIDGFEPLKLLHVLKHHIPDALLYPRTHPQIQTAKREVILSAYLIHES